MKLVKRVLSFDSRDWKHIWTLFKNMNKQLFWYQDYAEAYDSWMWIRIHFTYNGEWMEEDK